MYTHLPTYLPPHVRTYLRTFGFFRVAALVFARCFMFVLLLGIRCGVEPVSRACATSKKTLVLTAGCGASMILYVLREHNIYIYMQEWKYIVTNLPPPRCPFTGALLLLMALQPNANIHIYPSTHPPTHPSIHPSIRPSIQPIPTHIHTYIHTHIHAYDQG